MTEPSSPGWLCLGSTATDDNEAVALFEVCSVKVRFSALNLSFCLNVFTALFNNHINLTGHEY